MLNPAMLVYKCTSEIFIRKLLSDNFGELAVGCPLSGAGVPHCRWQAMQA
jgi:hypothetical protein